MLKKKRNYLILITLIFLVTFVFGCSKPAPAAQTSAVEPVSKEEFALDTLCKITIYDKAPSDIFDKSFAAIKAVEDKMSVDIPTSEVSNINKNAGVKPVKVSDDTYFVIKSGDQFSRQTNGKFDITVGPLVKLWGINTPHARIPALSEIKAKLPLVNYKNVAFNDAKKTVMLTKKGMSIDLGGIAKGYAGDAVGQVLRDNGIKHAIIDLGGNVLTIGSKPDGSNWRVGIQNPFTPRGDYFAIVSTSNKAIVTSGVYERFFIKNGKRYHHILDTSTGYPVDNGLVSVTIITDKSMNGDANAKAFCMGLQKGLKFIESKKGYEAIFVTKDSKVYITPGLKNSFKIVNDSFELMN